MSPDSPAPVADTPADPSTRARGSRAALSYVGVLVAVVAGLVLLAMLLGERPGIGRAVWLAVGALLGGLWTVRSRLPLLRSANLPVAGGAWLGLILAGLVTLAVAPTSLPTGLTGAATASASRARLPNGLRPAPPTAVQRTGTVGPAAQAKPAETPTSVAGASRSAVAVAASGSPSARPASGAARAAPTATVGVPSGFRVDRYIGKGDAYSCRDFASQAEAQAVLRADPTDPNVIDNDRDGIACEANPDPRDTRRVQR
jgi:hypothetical protein